MTMTLGDAVKQVRRGIHKYGDKFRTLVIVKSARQMPYVLDDIRAMLEASSLGVVEFSLAQMRITTEKGGVIRVAHVDDMTTAYVACAGTEYARILWLYQPDRPDVYDYVTASNRAADVSLADIYSVNVDYTL